MENTVQSWHYRSGFLPSPGDFIRSYQHIRRNRQTNLLRCWQIKEPWGEPSVKWRRVRDQRPFPSLIFASVFAALRSMRFAPLARSFDHLVCSKQNRLRNRQAKLSG